MKGARGKEVRGRLTIVVLVLVVGCSGARLSRAGGRSATEADKPSLCGWPMWRADPARSAISPCPLSEDLHLHWVRQYPPLTPAWPDEPRITFDHAYAPVAADGLLFVASPRNDSITALELTTGEQRWRFYTGGPVRLAPVIWRGRLYAVSDDGYLYCLEATTGKLLWRFRGGPSERKVLGNGRLISTWPARGGPVVADHTVYFTAGIWPFMGVFIHALDAETGRVVWTNDRTGSIYMKQPHAAPAFAGLAPQGYLAVVGSMLLVPNGRSVPACLDRSTGRLLYFRLWEPINYKRGNAFVAANSRFFVNDARLFDLATGQLLTEFAPRPVLGEEVIYTARSACEVSRARVVEEPDRWGRLRQVLRMPTLFDLPETVDRVWLKAADWLLTSRGRRVLAFALPSSARGADRVGARPPRLVWRADLDDTPAEMLVAEGRLVVVTAGGGIHCFGPGRAQVRRYPFRPLTPPPASSPWGPTVEDLLRKTEPHTTGYAVVLGIEDGRLVEELIHRSKFRVIAVDADGDRVAALRRRLDAADLYGVRAAVHQGNPLSFPFPPYLADLVLTENPRRAGLGGNTEALLRVVCRLLRPYGGRAFLPVSVETMARLRRDLEGMPPTGVELGGTTLAKVGRCAVLSRPGALPGAADWTHQYADPANTVVSKDRLVRAPLGLLWFGGSSNRGILPRHGHGPTPQVVAGRLIVEGPDSLRAMDIYTGRVLWERALPGIGRFYDNTAHQPGANLIGSNYVSAPDGIYVIYGSRILRLDPATGRTIREFPAPGGTGGSTRAWGFVSLWKDLLIAGLSPQDFWDPDFEPDEFRTRHFEAEQLRTLVEWVRSFKRYHPLPPRPGEDEADFLARNLNRLIRRRNLLAALPGRPRPDLLPIAQRIRHYLRSRPRIESDDPRLRELNRRLLEEANWLLPRKQPRPRGDWTWTGSSSERLVVMNRYSGRVLWTRTAQQGFRHNAIVVGTGRIYLIDRHPGPVAEFHRWRGTPPPARPTLMALDARTGRVLWQRREGVFGTWLGYSEEYDILIQARRPSRDMLDEKGERLSAHRGRTGRVLWSRKLRYRGPCLINGRTLFTQTAALDLLTGEPRVRRHPLTHALVPWRLHRNYGCNTIIGSRYLLTFRSGAAGFYDLLADAGTANLGGFKSGCTNNLIPAGGVLVAPDYTRTCICSYQNQTSLGLVHDPTVPVWTFNVFEAGSGPVQRVGINFGAPGDRRAPNGTLWLDYPSVGGPSPDIPIQTDPPRPTVFRRHPSAISASPDALPWVLASGLEGVRSIRITLYLPPTEEERLGLAKPSAPPPPKPGRYTLRLYFAEPRGIPPGGRVFHLVVEGRDRHVLRNLDVVREAGGPRRPLLKEIPNLAVDRDLTLTFIPADPAGKSRPIISGIEIIGEGR